MTASDELEVLYSEIRSCTRCALARTRTQAVPGEGPIDAEVLFIGEAPGVNEDRQGRPFVGQAGQFLEELLGAAGLRRSEVYICNVLKCRPPANRDPLPGEIQQCSSYLDAQVELVNPLVIVTLGRYSMGRYLPNQSISRVHGRHLRAGDRFLVPMYHPAAALHQQSLRETILEDFRKLRALIAQARADQQAQAPMPIVPSPIQTDAPAERQFRLFD